MPKFSVIVPIYKVEPYLRECVESVLRQTYQDFELILVDDGSPDGCPAICDAYAAGDGRVRVIHKKNGGLSDARNAGLDAAVGTYVYFLDGDDAMEPELLQTVIPHLESGMDMVVFGYRDWFADGTTVPKPYLAHGLFTMDSDADRRAFLFRTLLPFQIGWEAWSRVYVRENIEKYGLRFADNRVVFAEDLYFCLCYCAHAKKVVSLDSCLYNYRQRGTSIMSVQKKRVNIGRINELGKAVLAYLRQFDDCGDLVENFHTIHYLLIADQYMNQLWTSDLSCTEFRNAAAADVSDWAFLERQLKQQLRHPKQLTGCYPGKRNAEMISCMHFLLDGSYTAFRVRCALIERFGKLLDRQPPRPGSRD